MRLKNAKLDGDPLKSIDKPSPMTKPIRFDLPDLKLFAAVATAGSLSKGAASLPLALSAASSRLRQLEHRLGLHLFTRHAGGVRLTPAGETLLEHAQRILRAAQDAQQAMNCLNGEQQESLRLYANTTANSTVLPGLLGRFLVDRPYVNVALVECPSREVTLAVERGEADLGVIDSGFEPPGLLTLPMRHYRLAVLVAPQHALAQQAVVSFRELTQHDLVGLPEASAMQGFLKKMASLAGVDLHIRARAPSFAAIARLVASGVGAAVVPESTGLDYRDTMGLALVPLSDEWAGRELKLCLRPWESQPTTVRELAAFLSGLD
ncbi:LysR substrate-binding domain-containing protein [Chitinimonas sp. BJB300]|uniref:LysR substrate-binding domain-containing protein n=1 Tax=Chitinimonas sp. BJB300 TaxID=1559339 RepID=UPI000C11C888|nr:LysR substrate-binding domain-containing protein [Chitinimonas sp. BJB300]PHV13019.1 LysR family transcriptional regulator [Chitinimonas sp. BJB300]TSJ88923.1 LysR family transcriptional regulator [Chitinimonas sp. BJB300]